MLLIQAHSQEMQALQSQLTITHEEKASMSEDLHRKLEVVGKQVVTVQQELLSAQQALTEANAGDVSPCCMLMHEHGCMICKPVHF